MQMETIAIENCLSKMEDWPGRSMIVPKGTIYHLNKEGLLHNLEGPALIFLDGSKYYFKNGKVHNRNSWAVNNITCKYTEWFIEGRRIYETNS